MPELPDVEIIKYKLKPARHKRIKKVVVRDRKLRSSIPKGFTRKVAGKKIKALVRRAKYLVLRLNGLDILLHFGMTGDLRYQDQQAADKKHDKVIFLLSSGKKINYFNKRRLGLVTALKDYREHETVQELGVDPLAKDFTFSYLKQGLQEKKTAIKNALMDQTFLGGIGNAYAAEILFAAGISPFRKASSLHDREVRDLYKSIKTVLRQAIQTGIHAYNKRKDIGSALNKIFRVYQKKGEKCQRGNCRGKVAKKPLGGRATFYCPQCQK